MIIRLKCKWVKCFKLPLTFFYWNLRIGYLLFRGKCLWKHITNTTNWGFRGTIILSLHTKAVIISMKEDFKYYTYQLQQRNDTSLSRHCQVAVLKKHIRTSHKPCILQGCLWWFEWKWSPRLIMCMLSSQLMKCLEGNRRCDFCFRSMILALVWNVYGWEIMDCPGEAMGWSRWDMVVWSRGTS